MFFLAFLAGAIVLCAALSLAFHGLAHRWPASYGKSTFLSLIVALVVVPWSAIGGADGGPPNFRAAPIYLLAQTIVMLVAFARVMWLRRSRESRRER